MSHLDDFGAGVPCLLSSVAPCCTVPGLRAPLFVRWVNGGFSFEFRFWERKRERGGFVLVWCFVLFCFFLTVLWFVPRHTGCRFSFQYIKATV